MTGESVDRSTRIPTTRRAHPLAFSTEPVLHLLGILFVVELSIHRGHPARHAMGCGDPNAAILYRLPRLVAAPATITLRQTNGGLPGLRTWAFHV